MSHKPRSSRINLLGLSCAVAGWLLACAGLLLGAPAAETGYHVAQEVKGAALQGEGGWDYLAVDAAARRVYVTRSSKVVILDADKGTVIGQIPNLSGVHGVAVAGDLGRGFISNGRSSMITIFDLKTLAVIGEVKSTGENPDAILYDPPSGRVFAFNGRSGSATVLDGKTGKVAGTVELGGKPEFATTDLAGTVFVNIEDKSEVVSLGAKDLAVKGRWPLKPCEEPTGMAIDRAHHRLLIGCSNELAAVVDYEKGKLVTTLPAGRGIDGAAFDPGTGLGFTSNGEGTLTVIKEESPDRFSVVATVPTRKSARTIALDEKTHTLFLSAAELGPPPAATAEHPHPRPTIVPDSFEVLVVRR
jgi:DNA-binding beta-propeller fold protein YncE